MRLDDNLETDLDTPNRRKRYAEREKEKEEYRRNKDATSCNIRYPDSKNTYTPSDPSSDGSSGSDGGSGNQGPPGTETPPSAQEVMEESPGTDVVYSYTKDSESVNRWQAAFNSWAESAKDDPLRYLDKDWIPNLTKQNHLLGKLHDTRKSSRYVCSDFVIQILAFVYGNDWVKYFPSGSESSVVNNMNVLASRGLLRSNPSPGWNVFYKKDNNEITGHIGFVYFIDEYAQIIVHNGGSPGLRQKQVNIYLRNTGRKFNRFFTNQLDYDPMFIPLDNMRW